MHDTPAEPEIFATLYRRAFAEYGTRALWNKRILEEPAPDDALVIARALRMEGDREARKLAEQIEKACRAAPWNPDRYSPAFEWNPVGYVPPGGYHFADAYTYDQGTWAAVGASTPEPSALELTLSGPVETVNYPLAVRCDPQR